MRILPTVSVVIPCFNSERFVAEAVKSALVQTAPVLEVLVIDDGLTDRSAAVVAALGSGLVRLIRQNNRGESAARNRGIDEARGEWIAFLDADDVWIPTKIECQVEAIARCSSNDLMCVYSRFFNFGEWTTEPDRRSIVRDDGQLDIEDLIQHPIHISTALVRADQPIRFQEWTRMGEDVLYFAELSMRGQFACLPEPLAGYRRSSHQQTRDPAHLTDGHAAWLRWLDMHQERIGRADRARIEERLAAALMERLVIHKWRRQWNAYWTLRRYLATVVSGSSDYPALKERIYPPVLYRVKDWVDGLV